MKSMLQGARRVGAQATAFYLGQEVHIIDVCIRNTCAEYLIHYNGPIWVEEGALYDIKWII